MPTLQQLSNYIAQGTNPSNGLVVGVFVNKNRPHMKLFVLESKHNLQKRLETYLKNLSGSNAATLEYTEAYERGSELELTLVFLGTVSLMSNTGISKSTVGKNYCSFLRKNLQYSQATHMPWIPHFVHAGLNCKAAIEIVIQNGQISRLKPIGLLNGNCESSHEIHDVLARISKDNINFLAAPKILGA